MKRYHRLLAAVLMSGLFMLMADCASRQGPSKQEPVREAAVSTQYDTDAAGTQSFLPSVSLSALPAAMPGTGPQAQEYTVVPVGQQVFPIEASVPDVEPPFRPLVPAVFREIWGYVQAGDEASLDVKWPVSDVVLFGAGIGSTGKLRGVPDRAALRKYRGRVHLVIAELSNYALLHFCMSPDFPLRAKLLDQIAEAAKPFDGVNIDFESVLTEDADNFIGFLKDIKKRIGKKTLSVALPARTKKTTEAYDYVRVAGVADKVIIMAYDEHWSGSSPGSVASLSWCSKVARYALEAIGAGKLVMGLPFYGRAWGETNPSRAYRYPTVAKLIEDKGIAEIGLSDGSNYFEYVETIKVRVYYEDHRSVHRRAALYGGMGVGRIAFWRVGQEDAEIWNHLRVAAD